MLFVPGRNGVPDIPDAPDGTYECSDDLRDRQTVAGMRCAIVQQASLTLMESLTISGGHCFLHDITSKVPCCLSTKEDVRSRVLMGDEWIIHWQFEVRLYPDSQFCGDSFHVYSQEEAFFDWEGYIDFHSVLPLPIKYSCKT